jgi:hypothetical protein
MARLTNDWGALSFVIPHQFYVHKATTPHYVVFDMITKNNIVIGCSYDMFVTVTAQFI